MSNFFYATHLIHTSQRPHLLEMVIQHPHFRRSKTRFGPGSDWTCGGSMCLNQVGTKLPESDRVSIQQRTPVAPVIWPAGCCILRSSGWRLRKFFSSSHFNLKSHTCSATLQPITRFTDASNNFASLAECCGARLADRQSRPVDGSEQYTTFVSWVCPATCKSQ